MNETNFNVILASASPRRAVLLARIFDDFQIMPAQCEEKLNDELTPEENACYLAEKKCEEIYEKFPLDLVIGCDTMVVYDEIIFGKPADKEVAFEMLKFLSGKTHRVITGVCVISPKGKRVGREITEVRLGEVADERIKNYIDMYSPLDKAGAYGIQDGYMVKEYHGSYTNVMGLPLGLIKKLVKEVS